MTASKLRLIAATDKKLSPISRGAWSMRTKIANGRYVAAGAIVTNQITANGLPSVDSVTLRRRGKYLRKTF